jgi:hypothetical protein
MCLVVSVNETIDMAFTADVRTDTGLAWAAQTELRGTPFSSHPTPVGHRWRKKKFIGLKMLMCRLPRRM